MMLTASLLSLPLQYHTTLAKLTMALALLYRYSTYNTICFLGVPRAIKFPFCPCVCDATKLIKFSYWPGTPVVPQVAFSFEFMDLLEALLLECHVAVQDFTKAWSYLIAKKLVKVCKIYCLKAISSYVMVCACIVKPHNYNHSGDHAVHA